jgi:GDP-L-fucose synthase
MKSTDIVYIAGHTGLVGSTLRSALSKTDNGGRISFATKEMLDLRYRNQVYIFFENTRPKYVFFAAAIVGGIDANNRYPTSFLRDNLLMQTNVIDACHDFGVEKLLFLGSSCIYPKFAEQPIKEEYVLSGKLEPTNEPYAVAKIAGIVLGLFYAKAIIESTELIILR